MAWSIGINFRQTVGFATDGAGETYYTSGSYPQTRAGATFGVTSGSPTYRDADSALDPHIAGVIGEQLNQGPCDFRIDVPENGNYLIGVIATDNRAVASGTNSGHFAVLDGATQLFEIGSAATNVGNSGYAIDAAGNYTLRANIVNELVPITITAGYVVCRLISDWYPVFAHIYVEQVEAASSGLLLRQQHHTQAGGVL